MGKRVEIGNCPLFKLLYIDTDFTQGFGGDKNRSRFIHKSLKEKYDTDVLVITDSDEHKDGFKTINPCDGLAWEPQSVYNFSTEQMKKYRQILIEGKYDIVFIRFCSPAALAEAAVQTLPGVKVVVDVDMLLSRISELSWRMNKSIKNRFYLFEWLKLRFFERRFFKNNYLFLFSNPLEKDLVLSRISGLVGSFEVVPNIMELPQMQAKRPSDCPSKYVLFFGALGSAANIDAYRYLLGSVLPPIKDALVKAGVKVSVVGKDIKPEYRSLLEQSGLADVVDLVGKVDDINEWISGSEFVVLPLRVASGTRTRILEAAAGQKCVITTSIGAEGLDFDENEIILADNSNDFAAQIRMLLNESEKREQMAKKFKDKSVSLYGEKVVADCMVAKINGFEKSGLNVAIVTNRFYPEVGGAETNIFFQARKLAEKCGVSVFCPKRIDAPNAERLGGFELYRLKDWFNLGEKYPNIKTKTLTISIFFKILFGSFDVVMCFPALSYNNMLAFFAAKLSGKKIILCCFDWLDYSDIMIKEGKIDPNMLERTAPKRYQEFFLRRFDYIFAISNKEIEFFKKYNPRVGYSPVPILLDEYRQPAENPRSSYSITDDDFVFLSLGRVSKIKGQDIALEAFVKVAEKMPDAKLVFVGRYDYDLEIYERMSKLIRDNGLENRVMFTGMVERSEVLGWLRYSDIHIIPVRFMNSGAVVVESWISHTPVLQSDVVDPNLVVEGQTGYLFKSQSAELCAEKMLEAYRNRASLKEMGKAGEKLVLEKYTYEYLTDLYLKAFKEAGCE